MNFVEFIVKIKELENQYNWFSERDKNGILYWDLVRYDLTNEIYKCIADVEVKPLVQTKRGIQPFIQFVSRLFALLRRKWCKSYEFIFFVYSRNRTEEGKYTDVVAKDILNEIEHRSFVLDFYVNGVGGHEYEVTFDVLLLIKRKYAILRGGKAGHYVIADILAREFSVQKLDLHALIHTAIVNYKTDYKHYIKFITSIKPKAIFCVQAGIQRGLFTAARHLGIPMIELQHGLINQQHLGYSYPENTNVYFNGLPSHFISFSTLWTEYTNYPVKSVPLGNSHFAVQIEKMKIKYDLTLISSAIHTSDLNALLDQLVENNPDIKVCVKLHSNQFSEIDNIRSYYAKRNNISVVFDEINIKEILGCSNAILAIQSTCVYEALQAGVKVFLYKRKNFGMHSEVFRNPNVYLVEDYKDIQENIYNPFDEQTNNRFFDKFNRDRFYSFLASLQT